MGFVYWILATVILSAITGIFFTSFAVYIAKTKRKSDYVFRHSFYGGLLGGLLGTILGIILGLIVASLTPYGDDLLGFGGMGQVIVYMQVFASFWLIGIILGAIIGGLRYLERKF